MATTSATTAPPQCPVCAGTGWKVVDIPGKSSRVARCECRIEQRTERLLKSANIPSRYKHCTLDNFEVDFSGATRSLSEARLMAKDFVRDYPLERLGLLLIGQIGVGKTHLAVGIIQDLIRLKGHQCLFCDYRELLKEIQNSYNPAVQATELEILRPVFDAEVLVLDELGAVKPTEWVWDTVSFILNSRYNEKKTTLITTNFPDLPAHRVQYDEEETETSSVRIREERQGGKNKQTREITLGDRITDRMRSRLLEMCRPIIMNGIDFRTLGTSHHRR